MGSVALSRERQTVTETVTDHRLCALADIPNPGSGGFEVNHQNQTIRLMVIRHGSAIRIFENRCPHRRLPLDFKPGQFLDAEQKYILCTNHIALFRIDDGSCVDGPCKGASLNKFSASIRDHDVFVTL